MANKKETVLVVAAHPDDEILGCGGTLARHASLGDEVHILIVAEGATSRLEAAQTAEANEDTNNLQAAAKKAAEEIGAKVPCLLGLPDNRLDSLALLDVILPIEKHVEEIKPSIIYTHHGGDLNIDHRIVHQAVLTATRPMPGQPPCSVYAFETVSSTEWAASDPTSAFQPQRYVNISSTLECKRKALGHYPMEMRAFPHARSIENIEALARFRGASAGLAAAEGFVVLREIIS